jgi:hypothetical protein
MSLEMRAAPDPATGADLTQRIRSKRVMFLTPVHNETAWQYTRSLVETVVMMERYGIHHREQMVIGNSNLPRARNELAAEFLATDCTDAILIDSDMGWKAEHVIRLLASPQPYIGGVGKKRVETSDADPAGWCCRFLSDGREGLHQDSLGAIEVAGVGTGFLKIERQVFERLAEAHPNWKRPGFDSQSPEVRAKYYKFFRFPEEDDRGEDYALCDAWRDLGGRIWIDPDIRLGHIGSTEFSGDIGALFEHASIQEAA